jgi:hypothetical protein
MAAGPSWVRYATHAVLGKAAVTLRQHDEAVPYAGQKDLQRRMRPPHRPVDLFPEIT